MSPSVREPPILLICSRYDFSVDYVVAQLRRKGVGYFRLNTEDLPVLSITLDPVTRLLDVQDNEHHWRFSPATLRSVYFRRPVFLREFGAARPIRERFSRPQWAAFERSLALFSDAHWVNAPSATYGAESKPHQLALASECGFSVPRTIVGNSVAESSRIDSDILALKSLDVVYIEDEATQTFAYTQILNRAAIGPGDHSAPAIYQEALEPKLDLRVTVVGEQVFSASIVDRTGESVSGDWRVQKEALRFLPHTLPQDIEQQCLMLTHKLGLSFGGIDLALRDGQYYFIEINPTGEWSWLVDSAGLEIDAAIADDLCSWCDA